MPIIKREDIELLRQRARIEQVVGEYVTLRRAGTGTMKGLCPFHDEKTPSFNVRSQLGVWHCFGCGEGGDVIDFVMKINQMDFLDAIEFLAGKFGVTLHYEKGGKRESRQGDPVKRQVLLEIHKLAEEFYCQQFASPAGEVARNFLIERRFTLDQAAYFRVGYSLAEWDALARYLRGRGFTEAQLSSSGLFVEGKRGLYDRFRGRIMWPIRDLSGATVGFGARNLSESDREVPKYINTPETQIYHKSQVLYGLDLARKTISQKRQIVIVEGYTDVMAAHCAGITNAVATCGTAFGEGHVQIIRRLLADRFDGAAKLSLENGNQYSGEVIYTFDGDEAGMKAARRAYVEDQAFAARTFVAIDSAGQDPCDIRIHRGDQGLRDLLEKRIPLFEFVLQSVLGSENLRTNEGRVAALSKAIPVLAGIGDVSLRNAYSQSVSAWLVQDPDQVRRQVERAARQLKAQSNQAEARSGQLRSATSTPGVRAKLGSVTGRGTADWDRTAWSGSESGVTSSAQEISREVGREGTVGQGVVVQNLDLLESAHTSYLRSLPNSSVLHLEAQVLAVVLQHPFACTASEFEELSRESFSDRTFQAVLDAIQATGGLTRFLDLQEEAEAFYQQNCAGADVGAGVGMDASVNMGEAAEAMAATRWNEEVREAALPPVRGVIVELSTIDLPLRNSQDARQLERFARETVSRLQVLNLTSQLADLRAQINLAQDPEEVQQLQFELTTVSTRIRQINENLGRG